MIKFKKDANKSMIISIYLGLANMILLSTLPLLTNLGSPVLYAAQFGSKPKPLVKLATRGSRTPLTKYHHALIKSVRGGRSSR